LKVGDTVKQGEVIATMGRSTNTRQPITKDRAHVHFEINLRLNERFAAWHNARLSGQSNDHGNWNGHNMAGLDPRLILLEQHRLGAKFSLVEFIRTRPELCRVIIRERNFPFFRAYASLARRNSAADREGIAGFEVALDYAGLPFLMIPKSRAEIGTGPEFEVKSVNEEEEAAHPCRKLLVKRGGQWQLTATGAQLLDLLAWHP
jgi:hypothetical protein